MTHRTSLKPIEVMLERANALSPFSEATGILDNGCGPGPVMSRLIQDYGQQIPETCELMCADFSEGMIKQVQQTRESAENQGNTVWPRVSTEIMNAMDLSSIASDSKSHVTAGMVYFMTPDPQKCLTESRRVLKDGGALTLSSWEGSEWMDLMMLLPRVRPEKQMPHLPAVWSSAEALKGELSKAGFQDVETQRVNVTMAFKTHESIVEFMVTKMPHMVMMTGDMSAEEVGSFKSIMVEEAQKMCPSAPGELQGVALVAAGRK